MWSPDRSARTYVTVLYIASPMNEESRRSFVTWMLVVATLVTLGVAIQQHWRVTLKLQDPLGGHINDFDRWMIMAPRFLHDRVDYVDDQFPTPPLSLLVLAPFTALSRPVAQFAWVWVKLPLALLVFALAAGSCRARARG